MGEDLLIICRRLNEENRNLKSKLSVCKMFNTIAAVELIVMTAAFIYMASKF